jgi:hypothetical protein
MPVVRRTPSVFLRFPSYLGLRQEGIRCGCLLYSTMDLLTRMTEGYTITLKGIKHWTNWIMVIADGRMAVCFCEFIDGLYNSTSQPD